MPEPLTFEDCFAVIEREIQKRRSKWTLDAVAWLDWDDISQNLRIHIAKKFHLWDQSRPIQAWLARVIHNQLINAVRNHYSNFTPPCNGCDAYDGAGGCAIYGKIRDDCPEFARWRRTKEPAYNVNLPLSAFYHEQEIQDIPQNDLDLEKAASHIHEKMKEILKANDYKVYCFMFISHKTDEEVVAIISLPKNRTRDLVKVKQLRKKFISRVRKLIYGDDVDIK